MIEIEKHLLKRLHELGGFARKRTGEMPTSAPMELHINRKRNGEN